MVKFRKIDFGKMLYETLRGYFSVNSDGDLSILYKLCAAIVHPMQQPFDDYDIFRRQASIIASCKWQMGQLKNVLNYLFDNVQNRIFITQSTLLYTSATTFSYAAIIYAPVFEEDTTLYERAFFDKADQTLTTINIPDSVSQTQLVSVVEQIKLQGISYQIAVI